MPADPHRIPADQAAAVDRLCAALEHLAEREVGTGVGDELIEWCADGLGIGAGGRAKARQALRNRPAKARPYDDVRPVCDRCGGCGWDDSEDPRFPRPCDHGQAPAA